VDNLILPPSDDSGKNNGPAPAPMPHLLPQHLADLHKSGLLDEYIAASECFRSATDQAKIARCLRWKRPPKGAGFGPCLTISFLNRDSKPIGYYRFKPDIPRIEGEKEVKYESPKRNGDPAFGNHSFFPLYTRAVLADAATPLILTEGEKKACAADQAGFRCIGLTGVWNWTVKKKDGDDERELIPDLATVAWKDRSVFICFDSDIATNQSVAIAEWHLCQTLAAKAAVVKIVRLPAGADGAKCGLDDYLAAHSADDFRALLAAAQPPAKPEDDRPEVLLMALEYVAVEQAIGALAKGARDIYQRGGQLVRIGFPQRAEQSRRLTASGGPKIEVLPAAALRTRLTAVAKIVQFVEVKKGSPPQKMVVHPPQWLVPAVESAGKWPGIRPLEAVVTCPVVLADGSVLQRKGYHTDSGLLYLPTAEYPPIPEKPTLADARAAVEILKEAVCDFPFSKDVHLAGWFAALLTPLGRFAFHGPAPLFLIDANVRGSGKGMLADLISLIVAGGDFARLAYTTDDDEMRKVILAIALEGERLVLFDNLGGYLGNPSLDAALTSVEWQGRILGKTQQPRLPLLASWYATGNNTIVLADTGRRVCHIRLDSPDEKPEERTGFRHPDLLAWARENRGRLLTAAITILSAYCRAGKPRQPLKPWGSFEAWTDLIRGSIVWAGLSDPGNTREILAERSDREADAVRGLIAGWKEIDPDGDGKTTSQALSQLKDKQNENKFGGLREVLADLFDLAVGKLPPPQRLGKMLRKFAGRNVGGYCVDHRPGHGGVQKWFVRPIRRKSAGINGAGGSGGDGGSVSELNGYCNGTNGLCSGGDGVDGGSAAPIFTRIENATLPVGDRWENNPTNLTFPTMPATNGDGHLTHGPEVEEGYL
jgi:Domain of unknown function (DUF3854)